MKQKEIVLEQLNSMGFELIELEDMGYIFKYEGQNILYMPDDEDEKFLRIAIPHIFKVTDDNRIAVLEAMHETSSLLKYVKLYIMYETFVWAVYEHCLSPTDNMSELLEHIIRGLGETVRVFYMKINGEDPFDSYAESAEISDDEIDAEIQKVLGSAEDEE